MIKHPYSICLCIWMITSLNPIVTAHWNAFCVYRNVSSMSWSPDGNRVAVSHGVLSYDRNLEYIRSIEARVM